MPFSHLRILVTGATGGIGYHLVVALLELGAYVLLHGRSNNKLAALELPTGAEFKTIAGDLNLEQDRFALCQAATDQAVNVLINNAGVNEFTLFEQANIAKLIDINVTSTLQITQLLLPHLIVQAAQNDAMIVNIGSTFGAIGFPGYTAYCASKHAIKGFSEALGRELSDTGLTVLYVSPRATDTKMNSAAVKRLNAALEVRCDQPEHVARQIVNSIRQRRSRTQLGWPEKLQVKLNTIWPWLVDKAIAQRLETVKKYIRLQA